MESLNHYSRLRCLRGFQNSGQILNVRNRGVRKTRRVHFRCYSVFKMSQLLSNESQKLSQVCHILTKVSQRENAALASTAPGSCLTLCLCATLSILPATFCFSTTPQHCPTLRTLFQHFATHFGFVRPFQYPATFCSVQPCNTRFTL